MNITITRTKSTQSGTPGELVVKNAAGETFTCHTLELPWKENATGVSCIINDSYGATMMSDDQFGADGLSAFDAKSDDSSSSGDSPFCLRRGS